MKLEVTREVVNDLWPLCRSGDASEQSRALVDAYLAQDEPFATILKETETMSQAMPAVKLSPDAERRLLDDARSRARLKLLVIGGGITLAGLILISALMSAVLWMFVKG
jgi:ferric-dicitrate binding protein FerR (iron transport regulator)